MNKISDICTLLAVSQTYSHWSFSKVWNTLIAPAMSERAFLHYDNGHLVGIITFAKVSDEALAELKSGERVIQPQDWDSGNNIFFADIIAPFGGVRHMMRFVQKRFEDEYGKGVKGHWYRPNKERSGHAVA